MEAAGKRYIYYGSRRDEFRIWNLADLHVGSKGCAEGHIRADVERIRADTHAFWFGGGDYADFIGHTDKRFDPDAVAEWVDVKALGDLGKKSMERVLGMLRPIADKCLGMIVGNHEKKFEKKNLQDSLHGWLCHELGVPCLEYSAFVDLVFVRKPGVRRPRLHPNRAHRGCSAHAWRVFIHHGSGYAQTPGGKLNRLVQFFNAADADIYFCGHVHDQVARRQVKIGADAACKTLVESECIGVISGSYLKTYAQGSTLYGEMKGYQPTNLGAAWVTVCPSTRTVRAEV